MVKHDEDRVFEVIVEASAHTGYEYTTLGAVYEECELSRKTIHRHLQHLEAAGLIVVPGEYFPADNGVERQVLLTDAARQRITP